MFNFLSKIESQLSRYQDQLNEALRSTLESQENILVTLDCIYDQLSAVMGSMEDGSELRFVFLMGLFHSFRNLQISNCVSWITFIMYAQGHTIGKPNNIKVLGARKPKDLSRIAKIGCGHMCLKEENLSWSVFSITYIIVLPLLFISYCSAWINKDGGRAWPWIHDIFTDNEWYLCTLLI